MSQRSNLRAISTGSMLILALFLAVSAASPTSQLDARSITRKSLGTLTLMFNYQSQGNSFGDWMALLTLCLAPLVGNLIAGVPEPVYLSREPYPHWTDRIVLFNPTSVIWRYFVIFDRRVRCLTWTASDMAASNALFWTGHSWDGSEAMMMRSRHFCTRLPEEAHIRLISVSTIKTLAITLQAAQALYAVAEDFSAHSSLIETTSLATVFFPLAIIGLLRLPAAAWLSEDYAFANGDMIEGSDAMKSEWESTSPVSNTQINLTMSQTEPMIRLVIKAPNNPVAVRFRPAYGKYGVALRIILLLPLLALTAVVLYLLLPTYANTDISATDFAQNIFYLFLLGGTSLIFIFYGIRGHSTTTVIPCIASTWYKVYTAVMILMMVGLITVAALETRQTPCGEYTSYPPATQGDLSQWDAGTCLGMIPLTTSLISYERGDETVTRRNFTGWFGGTWNYPIVVVNGTQT